MGSASIGPLVAVTKVPTGGSKPNKILLIDPAVPGPDSCAFEPSGPSPQFDARVSPVVRISGNGDLITAVGGFSPSGVYLWSREGKTYKGFYEHDSWGSLLPSWDGRTVFAGQRIVTAEGRPVAKM